MRSGIAYQLPPLVRLTEETGSGLLPTPEASNTKAVALRSAGRSPRNFLAPIPTPSVCGNYNRKGSSKKSGDGLATWAKMWPTPRATDGSHGGRVTPRKSRNGGNLIEAVSASLWATPTAHPRTHTPRKVHHGEQLANQVGGSLNPTWVEWLMGFPLGWTVLEVSATRSSRKSSKRSAEQ